VLTHERNRASLAELEREWSLVDLIDAHLALDLHDELAHRVNEEQTRMYSKKGR